MTDQADGAGPSGPRGRATAGAADPADELLVSRLAQGDTTALAALYDRYGRPAYSLARRLCVDEGIAEDVVQEVFLAVWRDPGRFDAGRGAFGSWLLTLVHHKSVDAVRRESALRRRTVPAADDADERSAPAGPGADQAALGAVLAGQVRDALGTLPAEQRQALTLAYFGGYTQREVAALVGVPLGTVKSRMFTGVQKLRGVLAPLFGDVADDLAGGAR
ncbi:RNA polymerase sigma factor [Pseudonocardia benzenivorans]|uniref:RNA polymerase, sigma-24 subunit, ECF subfamily n=2 Tax=Pseudonocardia TaxID=1847 RepID=F4CY24_PSEUX|nr:sigma-70 family RNA polymerase sigma factor [Pseudonocardia dioxanivorans]AEA24265.1 RNA polymerase, sigma-24 subunit, ECF subfamily [Pseudonocardia dioxanivorans CB1190]GJF07269.1 RNA polymerase sigma factor SigK [Pseudonocardia sp. D17]